MKPKCTVCKKVIHKLGHARKITEEQYQFYRKQGEVLNKNDTICSKCRQCFYTKRQSVSHDSPSKYSDSRQHSAQPCADVITLPIVQVGKTSRRCCVCLSTTNSLTTMPEKARLCAFVRQGILVPVGVRCCSMHIEAQTLKPGVEIDKSRLRKTRSTIDSSELMWLLDRLRGLVIQSTKKRIDFDDPNSLSNEDILNLTGLTKDQFDFLVSAVTSLKKSSNRTPRTAIAILLVKLKTGLSHRFLATLFGIGSIRTVSKIVQQAKNALSSDFVSSFIGFHHISREDILEKHTSNFATQIFSDFLSNSITCIMDGTYVYIQKSHKYKFQRRCFSLHKHRPLLKPMVVTSTDGYIISILGPYLADGKNNDAGIVKHMMKSNDENMMKWFKKEDILILDRGFRDAEDFLQECGFRTESPAFLSKSDKQFSTQDANLSRLVTKIRWAVESVNGRIKTWRYFDKVIPNVDILNLREYLRIVCALCNRFKPPLINQSEEQCEIARQMLSRAKQPNLLQEQVLKDKSLHKRAKEWAPLNDCKEYYDDFPSLSDEYLRSITFGVYQLKQAPHYADQHLHEDGDVEIFLNMVSSTILQAKVQSRHTSSKKYYLWIEYNVETTTNPIVGWYCECKAGARTVGCCAHIATVLWYLGYARHQNYEGKPDKLTSSFEDAALDIDTETDLDSD